MICHEFPQYRREDIEAAEDFAPLWRMYLAWRYYETLSADNRRTMTTDKHGGKKVVVPPQSRLRGELLQWDLDGRPE